MSFVLPTFKEMQILQDVSLGGGRRGCIILENYFQTQRVVLCESFVSQSQNMYVFVHMSSFNFGQSSGSDITVTK